MKTRTFDEQGAIQLRQIRKLAGLDQETLAFKVGIHRTHVAKFETGWYAMSAPKLHKLKSVLLSVANERIAALSVFIAQIKGAEFGVGVSDGRNALATQLEQLADIHEAIADFIQAACLDEQLNMSANIKSRLVAIRELSDRFAGVGTKQ